MAWLDILGRGYLVAQGLFHQRPTARREGSDRKWLFLLITLRMEACVETSRWRANFPFIPKLARVRILGPARELQSPTCKMASGNMPRSCCEIRKSKGYDRPTPWTKSKIAPSQSSPPNELRGADSRPEITRASSETLPRFKTCMTGQFLA